MLGRRRKKSTRYYNTTYSTDCPPIYVAWYGTRLLPSIYGRYALCSMPNGGAIVLGRSISSPTPCLDSSLTGTVNGIKGPNG